MTDQNSESPGDTNAEDDNRRSKRRRTLTGVVEIVNKMDGSVLGRLVNMTTEGLMLVSTSPLTTDMLYQVTLNLPESVNDMNAIDLGMDCLWTSPTTPDADMYWSGCHIIDISQDMFATLEVLIEKLGD